MIFASVLCLVLCFALAGCGGETTVNRLISDYGITVDGGDFVKDASLVAAPPREPKHTPESKTYPATPKNSPRAAARGFSYVSCVSENGVFPTKSSASLLV